jgi:hypothetical protein
MQVHSSKGLGALHGRTHHDVVTLRLRGGGPVAGDLGRLARLLNAC